MIDAPSERSVPIWIGMITTERARSQWGLVVVAHTDARVPASEDALANAVQRKQRAIGERLTGDHVLLVQ